MILRGAQGMRYLAAPDRAHAGMLIHGADPMRVALKRAEAIAALIGPAGEAEMRLERMSGADLRREPAGLSDALRATGFFPGPRVAFVEEAGDGLADLVAAALAGWQAGDATLVVTAGQLSTKSTLRKLFEEHRQAVAVALYDEPPGPEEIAAELARAGIARPDAATGQAIAALAASLDPGDFRQTIQKIGLYKWGDQTPLSPEEVALLAPATTEADADALMFAVAEGRRDDIPALLRRLQAQGTQATGLCIAAMRHFRALHAAASDPAGPQVALSRGRPMPPRLKEAMIAQARAWGGDALERAIVALVDTDLTLRSQSRVPGMALVERVFLRLASGGSGPRGGPDRNVPDRSSARGRA